MGCGRRGFFFGGGCGRLLGPGCLVYVVGVLLSAVIIIALV